MFKINTKNEPRCKLVKTSEPSQCVRVYKQSPEDLLLQLWGGRRYMAVSLYPQEARAIAEALITAADEIQLKPLDKAELLAINQG